MFYTVRSWLVITDLYFPCHKSSHTLFFLFTIQNIVRLHRETAMVALWGSHANEFNAEELQTQVTARPSGDPICWSDRKNSWWSAYVAALITMIVSIIMCYILHVIHHCFFFLLCARYLKLLICRTGTMYFCFLYLWLLFRIIYETARIISSSLHLSISVPLYDLFILYSRVRLFGVRHEAWLFGHAPPQNQPAVSTVPEIADFNPYDVLVQNTYCSYFVYIVVLFLDQVWIILICVVCSNY